MPSPVAQVVMAAAQDTRAAVVIDQEVLTDAYAEPGEAARAGPGVSAGTRSRHGKGARMTPIGVTVTIAGRGRKPLHPTLRPTGDRTGDVLLRPLLA